MVIRIFFEQTAWSVMSSTMYGIVIDIDALALD
jgi:hypothetical protein